jgi:hypothetical protein
MSEGQPVVAPAIEGQRRAGSLPLFFAFTFAVTWTFFISAVALSGTTPSGSSLGPVLQVLVFLGTIAPSLVALALTARLEGRAGTQALLGRVTQWQVGARWYAFAIGYMAAMKLIVALVHRAITGTWPLVALETWYLMLAVTAVSMWVQAGEEIGWRGYALPRLAARFGLGGASVGLGVIWAVWHLPLFYLHGADTYGQSFPAYLLQVTALSVTFAWLYWRTRGSLLLVMLLHAAINNTKDIVPTILRAPGNPLLPSASLVAWLGAAVLWIPAAFFLVRMRNADLARLSKHV